jgi:hypothetical protein
MIIDEKEGITKDPICNEVIELIVKRHVQGMDKFGKTMASSERPFDEWITETIEELLDATHYLVKAKTIVQKFKTDNKRLQAALAQFEKESFKNEEESKSETKS